MGALTVARVYLDTCVVICLVEGTPQVRVPFLTRLERERPDPVVSDLTRMECRVRPVRNRDRDTLGLYDRFFSASGLETTPMAPVVFDLATEIRAELGLRVPDEFHVAAAVRAGCYAFCTNDLRLKAVERFIRVELTGP